VAGGVSLPGVEAAANVQNTAPHYSRLSVLASVPQAFALRDQLLRLFRQALLLRRRFPWRFLFGFPPHHPPPPPHAHQHGKGTRPAKSGSHSAASVHYATPLVTICRLVCPTVTLNYLPCKGTAQVAAACGLGFFRLRKVEKSCASVRRRRGRRRPTGQSWP